MKTFVISLLILFAFNSSAQFGTLKGTVTDRESFEPIAFAKVKVSLNGNVKGGANTDFDGKYQINNLVPGEYVVEFSADAAGYENETDTIIIEKDKIAFLDKSLSPDPNVQLQEVQVVAMTKKEIRRNRVDSRRIAPSVGATYTSTPSEPRYNTIKDNTFVKVKKEPLSTFSIDVDKSAYTQTRREIQNNRLPDKNLVRIEEFINYFNYEYPQPTDETPFSVTTEYTDCPWNKNHRLALIGVQGELKELDEAQTNNLVFLIDVSGSMQGHDRLELIKNGLKMLVKELRNEDNIAIVTYSGEAKLCLESTKGSKRQKILNAINNLSAGGSTNGSGAIQLAYEIAEKNFRKNGNNRIILATDGDFNVGTTGQDALVKMIEEKRENGVFLSILGVGTGNFQDAKMEQIADHGNGNYFYLDNILEAKRTVVTGLMGLLYTIAKDVKIQVEFNPEHVQSYRLIGYTNRLLEAEDFNDDKKDAGEMGAGHSVTALYEIVPKGVHDATPGDIDPLKYQEISASSNGEFNSELFTVKLRYKEPDGDTSKKIEKICPAVYTTMDQASINMRFASSVTEFGMLLRESEFKGEADFQNVIKRAKNAKGDDANGLRAEFINLVESAELLIDQRSAQE